MMMKQPARRLLPKFPSLLMLNVNMLQTAGFSVYANPVDEPFNPDETKEDDSEARSVFASQLTARLTARDLGFFFEDKLGEGTVMDSRTVTDRLSTIVFVSESST